MAADDLTPRAIEGQGPAGQGFRPYGEDYRQTQRPELGIDPYRLPGSGMAAQAEALQRVFKEFEGIGGNVFNTAEKKLGAEAGAISGAAGHPQPYTGLAAITAYGSAYDAAAHVSYINGTNAQLEDKLTEIEQDSPGDPVAFQTRAKGVVDAILKEAPEIYKPELQTMAALRMHAGLTRTRAQAIEDAKSSAVASYTDTVESRIDAALKTASTLPPDQQGALVQRTIAENRGQLDALVKARAITAEKASEMQAKFEAATTKAVHEQYTSNIVDHFMSYARGGDVDAADKALHGYLADPANSAEDKTAVTKAYIAEVDNFHQAQARLHANDIAAVGQALVGNEKHPGAYGRGIESRIHQLYKIGALSPEGLHSLLDQSMRNQVQSIKDDSANELLDAALHGGTKLDPTDHAVIKAADKYFQTHTEASSAAPLSDAWITAAAGFARQTNIIPPSVMSQIRIGLISGDPVGAARAAAAGERIRAANPQIDPWANDPKAAAIANSITTNLHAGMAPTAAYQLAVQQADIPPAQKEIVRQNYAQAVRANPGGNLKALQGALDSEAPGWFAHAPPAPVPMQAEFNQLTSTYYTLNGGNLDAARKLAAKQVQTTWGVSHMNGTPELVKWAPERLGVTPEQIRADVASSVQATGYSGDPAQVHLVPNAETDASAGRVWGLVHTDPTTGLSDVILNSRNQPVVYHVPAPPDFAKAQQARFDERLAQARQLRADQRKNTEDRIQGEEELANQYLSGNPQQRAMAGR